MSDIKIGDAQVCLLCQTPISQKGYRDEDLSFCCSGCHAVYQILSCQNALDRFQEHPLFKQAVRSGLISNPELLQQVQQHSEDLIEGEWIKLHLEIQNMWCPSCAQVIYLVLMQEKGVRQCIVDYSTDLASIEYNLHFISKEKIFRLIEQLGYYPLTLQDPRNQAISRSLYLRLIIATFCSLNVMMFAYPIYASYFDVESTGYTELFAWLSGLASLPVLTYCAWPIWRRFYTAMKVGVWGMETLILIGVAAAFSLSVYELLLGSYYVYFDSMTVIIVFVLLGKMIESKAKFSAKDSLLRLTRGLPRRGRKLLENGLEQFVSLKEIEIGNRIVVLTGEKIVLDGVVEEGEGTCDESIMTGEALPLSKKEGSTVLAGSLLQQGKLIIKVTAKPEETALYRIIAMIEQDISHKSQYVRAVDHIVKWFVPLVLLLAFLVGGYFLGDGVQTAIIRAMSVILISCPCAIGIAAPLAEAHSLNALAKKGAIVRNRGCLPFLGKEAVFIFDKTGTITEGKFTVLEGLNHLKVEDQSFLKALVSCSNHPIAIAINKKLEVRVAKMESIEEVIGKGMRGWDGEDSYYLGSASFLKEQGVILPPIVSLPLTSVNTTVFFAKNGVCLATIALGDRIRLSIKEVLQELKPVETWLVSGDSKETVEYVAGQCGFDRWVGEYHPLQKRQLVEELKKKGKIVAMLGDGINDAPALTASHLGIAVVSATDISIQVSDILLTSDKLQTINAIRQIGIKGHRILKQNLFWAFFYNVVGIGLAIIGWLSPLFAAFAMVVSSLIVLLNAQRISKGY